MKIKGHSRASAHRASLRSARCGTGTENKVKAVNNFVLIGALSQMWYRYCMLSDNEGGGGTTYLYE
jgi:hypothetical protein